jgi:hypothetical protein
MSVISLHVLPPARPTVRFASSRIRPLRHCLVSFFRGAPDVAIFESDVGKAGPANESGSAQLISASRFKQ